MQQHTLSKKPVVFLLAMCYCLLGGSAFPAIKIGYRLFQIASHDSFSIILFAGIRFFLAGVLTVSVAGIAAGKLILPRKGKRLAVAGLGLVRTALLYTLLYIGIANTTGVESAILNGTNIIFAMLASCFLFRQEAFTSVKLAATLICFLSIVLLNLDSGFHFRFTWRGSGLVLLSAVVFGVSDCITKGISRDESPVTISGWQFAVGGFVLTAVGLLGGGRLPVVTGKGVLVLLYLIAVAAVAFILWGLLLKHNPISRIVGYKAVEPICGAALSALVLSEYAVLGVNTVLALACVCTGIVLLNRANDREQAAAVAR